MKIIEAISGGGKTTELAKVAAELLEKGKSVQVISEELGYEDFKEYVNKYKKSDKGNFHFAKASNIKELVEVVFNRKYADAFLIDGKFLSSDYKETYSEINMLRSIGEVLGKEIVITNQPNSYKNKHVTVYEL